MVTTKADLKARLSEYLQLMQETGEEIIITDQKNPVGKIIPFRERKKIKDVFSLLQGSAVYNEDPTTPTTDEWPEI
jgi:prevent-host-death family protein